MRKRSENQTKLPLGRDLINNVISKPEIGISCLSSFFSFHMVAIWYRHRHSGWPIEFRQTSLYSILVLSLFSYSHPFTVFFSGLTWRKRLIPLGTFFFSLTKLLCMRIAYLIFFKFRDSRDVEIEKVSANDQIFVDQSLKWKWKPEYVN